MCVFWCGCVNISYRFSVVSFCSCHVKGKKDVFRSIHLCLDRWNGALCGSKWVMFCLVSPKEVERLFMKFMSLKNMRNIFLETLNATHAQNLRAHWPIVHSLLHFIHYFLSYPSTEKLFPSLVQLAPTIGFLIKCMKYWKYRKKNPKETPVQLLLQTCIHFDVLILEWFSSLSSQMPFYKNNFGAQKKAWMLP